MARTGRTTMAVKLYTPARLPGLPSLLVRIGVVFALLAASTLIVYFEGGLVDSHTGRHPELLDCVYFVLITITTVGYGDIVPVDTPSRLVDALVLTPIRFIVLLIFFGTAYQLSIKQFQEEQRMKRAVSKLNDHTIVCGYGTTGQAAVRELLLHGTRPDQIVVVDVDENALRATSGLEVVAIQADAAQESTLNAMAIQRAAHVLICTGRDDTAVLTALTVQALNPDCRIVAMCRQQENVKLLQRSGVHSIISPALAGGTLIAAATRQDHIVDTMKDLLSVGGAIRLDERVVRADEVGTSPRALKGITVLRVYRNDRAVDPARLDTLAQGDILVFVAPGNRT